MFILASLVPLGLNLLEKAIFGYSKAVARLRMGEIQNVVCYRDFFVFLSSKRQ